jgi:hypothetical protein
MALRLLRNVMLSFLVAGSVACGPRPNIPPRPLTVPGAVTAGDSLSLLAVTLAPVLYLQPDEWFPLERVVAVIHPERPFIAYHLLWRDDVNGSWIPFTIATDQEMVWVEHDGSGSPTALWTYWHIATLRTDWRGKGLPEVDVQWGKHGSVPRNTVLSDLPDVRTMNVFYLTTWLGLIDIWLGNLTRPGPWCFCRSYRRYVEFSRPLPLADRLDAVVVAEDPHEALRLVFGERYSRKPPWPWLIRDKRQRRPAAYPPALSRSDPAG